MRDFFITSLEKLIAVFVVLMIIVFVVAGFSAMFSPAGSFLRGLAILIGGGLYVILVGGMLYLFLGVYHNTKRTAELLALRTP